MNGHYCRCCGATDRAIEVTLLACSQCVETLKLGHSFPREELIRLYQEGHGLKKVASLVGISYEGVRQNLVRAGVPRRSVGIPSPVTQRERREAERG